MAASNVKPQDSIKVSKLPTDVTEGALSLFFANRRKSGGGEIKRVKLFQEKGARIAVITYQDYSVVERVLQKLPLVFKGKQIVVESLPDFTSADENSVASNNFILQVTGVKDTTSIQSVEKYFESHTSNESSIKSVLETQEDNKRVFYIKFSDAEAAKQVLQLKHTLDGATIHVKEYTIQLLKVYDQKLLIKGVNPSTTKDGLENFLEAKAGTLPEEMIYGKDGTVLVSFEEEPDFVRLRNACKKRKLDGNVLSVYQVPVSRCVLVEGKAPWASKDHVTSYFECTPNAGKEVEKVELDQERVRSLVYFEDAEGIDEICKRQHVVGGKKLEVTVYHHLLQGDNVTGNSHQQSVPNDEADIVEPLFVACKWKTKYNGVLNWKKSQRSIPVSSVGEKYAWEFMLENKNLRQDIASILAQQCTEVVYDKDFEVLKVTCNKELHSVGEVDSWWATFLDVLKKRVVLVKVYLVQGTTDDKKLIQYLQGSSLVKSQLAKVEDTECKGFLLMGLFESISKLLQERMGDFQTCQVMDMVDCTVVKCEEVTMSKEQILLVKKFACTSIIQKLYRNVWAAVNDSTSAVFITGPDTAMKQIKTVLEGGDWLSHLVTCCEVGIEEAYLVLFSHPSTRSYVDQKLLSVKTGVFMLEFKTKLLVYAENQNIASDVENQVKRCFTQHCTLVKNASKLKVKAEQLVKKYIGKCSIHLPPSAGKEIQIVATDDIFRTSDLKTFLDDVTKDAADDNQIMTLNRDDFSLLNSATLKQIETFGKNLNVLLFTLVADDKSAMLLRGPVDGINKTRTHIVKTIADMKEQLKGAQIPLPRPANADH